MKKFLFSFIILLAWCVCAGAQGLEFGGAVIDKLKIVSMTEALDFAKDATNPKECDYYIGEVQRTTDGIGSSTSSTSKNTWLVFVDEHPNAGWEHPCKYVYVSKYKPTAANKPDISIIDSLCPPGNVKLRPIDVKNRLGNKAKVKPLVRKAPAGAVTRENPAAGHTYAVILNGGMLPTANKEKYWNDCSFIYQTLRNTYQVPKENIKVLISDGTDPADDMELYAGGYGSSPLDLDGDSIPDTEYAATKENFRNVLSSLAAKLTDDDHLFIFTITHGGTKKQKDPYLYMWNNERLSVNEFASYLEPVNAGFITVVMGQCYSGNFVDGLKKPNRIIITACKGNEMSFGCPELPFCEFLYHWTCAVNGSDAYGNELPVTSCRKGLPIVKAWDYASKNDIYANSDYVFAHETPMQSSFTHSVANDLSFDSIPPTVDLCFDYYGKGNEMVSELKTKTYKYVAPPTDRPYDYATFVDDEDMEMRMTNFWDCPYIWIRNQEDGEENQETERPVIEEGKPIYVYVNVRNRGVKPYRSNNTRVKTYWAQSSMMIPRDQWIGYAHETYEEDMPGGSFSSDLISDSIPAGQYSLRVLKKWFTGEDFEDMQVQDKNLCILAYITEKKTGSSFPTDGNGIAAVWSTNKLAQSNVWRYATLDSLCMNPRDTMRVIVPNLSNSSKKYDIRVKSRNSSPAAVFSEAKVSVNMSKDLMQAWKQGGSVSQAVEADRNVSEKLYLLSDSCSIDRITLNPRQVGNISLNCNFLAGEAITERKSYDIDLAIYDSETGQCLGGETFRIVQNPRPAINPEVELQRNSGDMVLSAANVNEDAMYEWYNADGVLVGSSASLRVPAGMSAGNYTVKVEAKSDGAVSYSEVSVPGTSAIKNVEADGSIRDVVVTFERPVQSQSTLRLASSSGNAPVSEYSLAAGAERYSIPAAGMQPGVYQVTLIENGRQTGSHKFVK